MPFQSQPQQRSLTAKLAITGLTFLVLALASISLTLWVSWKLEGGAAAVNEAGRLRMMTYRLALNLPDEGGASQAANDLAQRFEESLQLLANGDPSRPLFVPWSATSRQRFEEVEAAWTELRKDWFSVLQPRAHLRNDADQFAGLVDRFVADIEHSLDDWTAMLHMFQLAMMGLAIASALALLYTGYLLVLQPVAQLRRGIAALQAGELGTRLRVVSSDEFGQLAAGFNDMAQTLQSLYGRLEERVREKTARLEEQRQRLTNLYEVSRFLAQATQLDTLAEGFVRHARRIAHADAAALRWSDEENQRYILLASDALPESMRAEEQCLDTGSCRCGQPAAEAKTRVIPIRLAEPAPMKLCEREGFDSLISVPVRLHDTVLGELDLLYRGEVELAPTDRELLETLAGNLAGAMESLRATALEREALVADERGLIARELHDSIAQSLAFLKIQVQLLRDARRKDDATAVERIIDELDAGVRESYADVRELLVHFRVRTQEEDIEPALAATLSKFTHQSGIAAQLRVVSHGVALPPDVQNQVLHILQEALSNVRKHAHANEVVLTVHGVPHWCFEVRDDGCGFDMSAPGKGDTHVGLRIMQERALRISATVAVNASPGAGCTVRLELPPGATRPEKNNGKPDATRRDNADNKTGSPARPRLAA